MSDESEKLDASAWLEIAKTHEALNEFRVKEQNIRMREFIAKHKLSKEYQWSLTLELCDSFMYAGCLVVEGTWDDDTCDIDVEHLVAYCKDIMVILPRDRYKWLKAKVVANGWCPKYEKEEK